MLQHFSRCGLSEGGRALTVLCGVSMGLPGPSGLLTLDPDRPGKRGAAM